MKQLVFVYGTLKKGYGNHVCIEHPTTKYLGVVETPPIYTLYNGGYPIVERNGNTAITGELYEVNNEDTLKDVYSLEGYSGTPGKHNGFYDVDTIPTPFGEAEIFVMDKSRRSSDYILTSGVWGRD